MPRIQKDAGAITDPMGVVPEAAYTLRIHAATLVKTKETDLDMIRMDARVAGGNSDDIADHLGKPIFDYMVIEGDKAKYGLFRMAEICRAIDLDPDDFDLDEWANCEFEAHVSIQAASGGYSESNRIQNILTD